MKGMQGCKVFRCDNCGVIRPIKQQNIVKAAYTNFSHKSEEKLIFNVYHIQLCKGCYQTKKGKK